MRANRTTHSFLDIAGLAAMLAIGVLLAVFSGEIYQLLGHISFLRVEGSNVHDAPQASYESYTPGEYTASAFGYESDVTVVVEVSRTELLSIQVNASGESAIGVSAARSVRDAILAAQSVDVDVVSGATYSSRAVMEAVALALAQAGEG